MFHRNAHSQRSSVVKMNNAASNTTDAEPSKTNDEDEDDEDEDSSDEEDEEDVGEDDEPVGQVISEFDFEVVGLLMNNNGRECNQHEICGEHLSVGEIVKLIPATISNINGIQEEAIAVYRIIDGAVGCRVGFVPRVQAQMLHRRNEFTITPFAVVKDLYRYSNNEYLQCKSKRNYGMACCSFIEGINIGSDTHPV